MSLHDCFRAPEALITLDQALDFLTERLQPVVTAGPVPLVAAVGRVLAENVVAPVTNPPFACSAMDGFALAFDDLADAGQPARLTVTARIAAGHVHDGTFGRGEAARIFTGAPLPPAFDTVVLQEDCRLEGDSLWLPEGVGRGDWVRPAGQDVQAGSTVLTRGRRLRPQDVAMAASVGRTHLEVYRPLVVGVFSTGDELVEPGHPLPPGRLYGCNRAGMLAAVQQLGCQVVDLGNVEDRLEATRECLAAGAERVDLLLTSGGMSVGGEDHVKAAVQSLGAISMWRMAIKPGKPTALGHVGKAAFVGLSGYPVSCLVTLMMIARPVILRLSGAVAELVRPWRLSVPAAFSFEKKESRRQFLRVSLDRDEAGRPTVRLFASQEPNVLSSLVHSDGLVDLAEDLHRVSPGDMVDFIPYSELLR
jgi:molybdopterin molybdotransferase